MPAVNIDEYQYQFDKVMANETTRACFMKYLKQEYNDEPLLFWEDCKTLQNTSSIADTFSLLEQVNTIYNTYIRRGGKKELNISSPVLKQVTDHINVVVSSGQEAYELFQPALLSVVDSLERDSFARFIRSDMWIQYVRKLHTKSVEDMDKVAIHKSQLKQMTYSIKDMERPYINEYDLKFALHMSRDGMLWECIKEFSPSKYKYVKKMTAYNGHLTILDDETKKAYSGKFFMSKVNFIIKYDAKTLFLLLHSKEQHDTVFGSVVEHTNMSERDVSDTAFEENALHTRNVSMNFVVNVPLFNGRVAYGCTTSIEVDNTYIFIAKPTLKQYIQFTEQEPEPSKKIVTACLFCWTICEAIDDNTCRLTIISAVDPGGLLSNNNSLIGRWTAAKSLKKLSKNYAAGSEKALRWYEENGRPPLNDSILGVADQISKNTSIAQRFTLSELKKNNK
jgi:hypothetical protein